MKFYIEDTTVPGVFVFDSLQEIISHLEGTVKRKFGLSRKQYMQNVIELGYGYDDDDGSTFVQSMTEYFNIGVVRNGHFMRTNIHEALTNYKYRTEYGD